MKLVCRMTEPPTHLSSTSMTIASVQSNSSTTCITQTTPSGNGITPINPIVAVNIPAISAMPVAMQGLGNLSNLPLAMCAVNSPQQPILPSNTSTSIPSPVTNNSGIILLNVGATAPNNLAAALSQIVAGAGLVQQSQVLQAPLHTPSAVQTSDFNNNQMAASQSFSTAVNSMAVGSQTFPVVLNQIPSAVGNMQKNNTVSVTQLNYQQAVAIHPHMAMNTQQQVLVQGQPKQEMQAQPAAFMIVPIPQIPSVQPETGNLTNSNVGCSNLNHNEPQQYVLNIPSPMASFPSQSQLQNVCNLSSNLPKSSNIQKPALCATQKNISNNIHSPTLNTMPKNDELKAFLIKPGTTAVSKIIQTGIQSTEEALTPQFFTSSDSSSLPSRPQIMPCQVKTSPNLNLVQGMLQHNNSMPQYQSTVSSPGLSFLAQISTLSSTSSNAVRKSSSNQTNTSMTIAPSVMSTLQQVEQTKEVCDDFIAVSCDETNSRGSSPSTTVTGTSTTSIMTVSSTTKLGDNRPNEMSEHASENAVNTSYMEMAECSNFPYTAGSAISTTTASGKQERKRKKGPAPKLNGTETCLICGDKSTGYHYNILSCEGCKGFFRRSVIKGAKYSCKGNGDCHIDLYMRRKCQECRFQKCKRVGMKEESVLSEEQVKAKKLKKECDEKSSTFNLAHSVSSDDSSVPKLTPQQRKLVELLNANERRFQWPTTEDMKKVTAWVENDDSLHSRSLRFAHFTELCILIVQLVVEFTKQLPGFLTVLREDQIVLLKACAIEVMLLRAAKQYNKHDGTINFLNGKLYDKSSFYRAGMQVEFVDPIFQFCKSMAQLDLDETEYAILVAINTFSTDRPHIKDIEKVESMQDPYVELLRVYTRIRHPNDPLMFARILMKIVELRTLNNYHSEQMFALKVQDRKLPPLLAEIWDM